MCLYVRWFFFKHCLAIDTCSDNIIHPANQKITFHFCFRKQVIRDNITARSNHSQRMHCPRFISTLIQNRISYSASPLNFLVHFSNLYYMPTELTIPSWKDTLYVKTVEQAVLWPKQFFKHPLPCLKIKFESVWLPKLLNNRNQCSQLVLIIGKI